MRLLSLLVCVGCAGNELDAPDDCGPDELHVIHGDADERLTASNYVFANALGDQYPGQFDVANGQVRLVHIDFDKLAPRGATVPARGNVTLPSGFDVGNCETGDLDGLIYVDDGYWRFELVDVARAPYCGGASVKGSVQGCFRAAP